MTRVATTDRGHGHRVAEDEGGEKRRGHHYTAKRFLSELDTSEEAGREAGRRTLR